MSPLGLIAGAVRPSTRPAWAAALRAAAAAGRGAASSAAASCCSSGSSLPPGSGWLGAAARALSTFTAASPTKLEEIMHVDQLRDKAPDEIEQIWLQFHEDPAQRRVADVMSADEYRQLQARARSSPMFVLPLAKPGGFMTLLLNWQGPVALLTSLEEYRQYGPGAPPHMTLTHYTELSDSKNIVLVRGDVISDHVVNLAEGRTLLQLARAFYTDPSAHRHVYRFNHEPEKFSMEELLAELGLDANGAKLGSSGGGGGGGSSSSSGSSGGGQP